MLAIIQPADNWYTVCCSFYMEIIRAANSFRVWLVQGERVKI